MSLVSFFLSLGRWSCHVGRNEIVYVHAPPLRIVLRLRSGEIERDARQIKRHRRGKGARKTSTNTWKKKRKERDTKENIQRIDDRSPTADVTDVTLCEPALLLLLQRREMRAVAPPPARHGNLRVFIDKRSTARIASQCTKSAVELTLVSVQSICE